MRPPSAPWATGPRRGTPKRSRTPAPGDCQPVKRRVQKKGRYHHGDLHNAAIRRARELVALRGPSAITLRGVARDLGVTAPALVYYFGTRAAFRAAVAESVREELAALSRIAGGGQCAVPTIQQAGQRWIGFAADNPLLYRLASGDGWCVGPGRVNGAEILAGPSPTVGLNRRIRHMIDRGRQSGHVRADGSSEHACMLTAALHGLALLRADGVDASVVDQALAALVAGVAGDRPPPTWALHPPT